MIRQTGIDRLPDVARDVWEGTSSKFSSGARSLGETLSETTDAVRRGGDQMMDRITETGERMARTTAQYTEDLPDQAGNLITNARENLAELFETQPLAIGAVGLAIGAALPLSFL